MSRIRSDAYAVVHPHQRARAVRLLDLPSRNVLCEGDPLTGLCGIRMVVRTYPATHPKLCVWENELVGRLAQHHVTIVADLDVLSAALDIPRMEGLLDDHARRGRHG